MENVDSFISYDKECEPIVISKSLIDLLQKYSSNWPELFALYSFYYYTAKWQHTNQIRSTTSYTAKGMNWSEEKVRRNKKDLVLLGLVEDIQTRGENNQILKHYIKVMFIWSQEKVLKILEKLESIKEKSHPTGFPESGSSQSLAAQEGNALSISNRNALSISNRNSRKIGNNGSTRVSPIIKKKSPPPTKKEKPKTEFSQSLDLLPIFFVTSQKFVATWREWWKFRNEVLKKKMSIHSAKKQINILSQYSVEEAIGMIDQSIAFSWNGIFPVKSTNNNNGHKSNYQTRQEENNHDRQIKQWEASGYVYDNRSESKN